MSPKALEVKHLSVLYGGYAALSDISFSLDEGQFLAIVGPNGGGKSTLLKTLLGLIQPTHGSVATLGGDPRALPPNAVGYVPQVKTLNRRFPALAWELVVTGLLRSWPWRAGGELREKALAAMRRTGVEALAMRAVGELSGGELQRVYLARSLVREPRIILLDEPAAGMDISGEADMLAILEREQSERGASVAMITHDVLVARHHADRVLLLNRAVLHDGPPEESLSEANLRRAYGHVGHAHVHGHSAHERNAHEHSHEANHENLGAHDQHHDHDKDQDLNQAHAQDPDVLSRKRAVQEGLEHD